jgi:hypothetical protein
MPSRVTIFRIAAITILLLTGLELVACEVFSPATCEISGVPISQNNDARGTSPNSGDACLCCCSHIVIRVPFVFKSTDEAAALKTLPPIRFSSVESASIYHPPKA